MSEHDHQATFFRILENNQNRYPDLKWFFAIPNASGIGGKGGVVIGAKFKREGRKSGVWDTFFPLPMRECHGLFIEFKFSKSKLSDTQQDFGGFIERKRYGFGVAYTADEGIEILEKYTGWKLNK